MPTPRERAHDDRLREITAVARRQLAGTGAAGLSLRAVAREVGLVSSALYRYVPNRDALLTALLVEAYDSLGEACERAEARVPRAEHRERLVAAGRAARRWALARPQEWALLYGSPVPGFAAPQDTVAPAARFPLLILAVLRDAAPGPTEDPAPTGAVASDLAAFAAEQDLALDPTVLARALMTWTALVGAISFELGGHLVGSVRRYPAWFDHQLALLAGDLGL